MKKLLITVLLLIFGLSYASAQRKTKVKVDKTKLTPEQRMVQSNAKRKNGGRDADIAKKVQRAKKQDHKARKTSPRNRRTPKRK